MKRRSLLLLAPALACSVAPALAATYPTRPIRFIIPSTPGGVLDLMARSLITSMSASLGQPIIPDNKPGAQQMLGADLAARAPADGYTMVLAGSVPLAINPHILPSTPFDPRVAFSPVSLLAKSSSLIVVPAASPLKKFSDLLEHMQKGGRTTYATGGIGTSGHLTGELLRQRLNLNMEHIPFTGNGGAINAALGGHVDFLIDFVSTSGAMVKAGNLRALAVSTLTRVQALPEVPTIAETIPGFEVAGWMTVCVPAGTPPEIIAQLATAVRKALDSEDVTKLLLGAALLKNPSTPEEAKAYMLSEYERWGEIIRRGNVKYS